MRPAPRLIVWSFVALVLTGLAIPLGWTWLFLAPWVGLFVLLVVDVASSTRPRQHARLVGGLEIFASEVRDFELQLNPPAPVRMTLSFDWPDGLTGPDIIEVEPGAEALPLPVMGRRRGAWTLDRVWPVWPSRMGLVEFVPKVGLDASITVLPDLRPISSGQIDVSVNAVLHGQKSTFVEGEGSEFHQLRDFVPGEGLRKIDWKRSARQRRLLSKETRSEQNHNVIICLDSGYLMREEFGGLAKLDHAINAGLAVSWAASIGGDRVGLYTYDSQPRHWLPPAPGRNVFAKLRQTLGGLDYDTRESNHTLGMATLNGHLNRRSLVIVFSDFVDTTTSELMVEQLAYMSKRHLVIFIALRDAQTTERAERPAEDLEEAAETIAASDLKREREIVLERLNRLGVRVMDTDPRALSAKLVSTYLNLKAQEVV